LNSAQPSFQRTLLYSVLTACFIMLGFDGPATSDLGDLTAVPKQRTFIAH
jgi:hypothetical protein